MKLYFKATKAYAGAIFRPDEDELEDPGHSNVFERYANYTMDDLMIVDDATGCYVSRSMPKPFNIPGRIYWYVLNIWQTKIVRTHI